MQGADGTRYEYYVQEYEVHTLVYEGENKYLEWSSANI